MTRAEKIIAGGVEGLARWGCIIAAGGRPPQNPDNDDYFHDWLAYLNGTEEET